MYEDLLFYALHKPHIFLNPLKSLLIQHTQIHKNILWTDIINYKLFEQRTLCSNPHYHLSWTQNFLAINKYSFIPWERLYIDSSTFLEKIKVLWRRRKKVSPKMSKPWSSSLDLNLPRPLVPWSDIPSNTIILSLVSSFILADVAEQGMHIKH